MPLHFLFFFCAFAFLAVCFCWWISRRPSCDVTVAGVVRAHVLLGRLYFILLLGKFKALFPTIAGSSCEVIPLCRLNFVFSEERSGGPSSSLCVFSCLSFKQHPAPAGPSYDLACCSIPSAPSYSRHFLCQTSCLLSVCCCPRCHHTSVGISLSLIVVVAL